MKVEVAIDTIALVGFPLAPGDRAGLHAAIEQHLTTLLADPRALSHLRSHAAHQGRADGRNTPAGADVNALGASVAKAIYSAIAPSQAKG
jgi:hypothetical protein